MELSNAGRRSRSGATGRPRKARRSRKATTSSGRSGISSPTSPCCRLRSSCSASWSYPSSRRSITASRTGTASPATSSACENYRLIFQNPVIYQVFINSLIFLVSVPLILVASVVVAVLVYEKVLGWRTFRFLFFIPDVLSPVIVGVLFSTFFLPAGVVDKVLSPFGLETSPGCRIRGRRERWSSSRWSGHRSGSAWSSSCPR